MKTAIAQNKALLVRYGKGKKQFAPVNSLYEAGQVVREYTEGKDLGMSQWYSEETGKVYDAEGKYIARISYNGRAWDTSEDFKTRKEIPSEVAKMNYYS